MLKALDLAVSSIQEDILGSVVKSAATTGPTDDLANRYSPSTSFTCEDMKLKAEIGNVLSSEELQGETRSSSSSPSRKRSQSSSESYVGTVFTVTCLS